MSIAFAIGLLTIAVGKFTDPYWSVRRYVIEDKTEKGCGSMKYRQVTLRGVSQEMLAQFFTERCSQKGWGKPYIECGATFTFTAEKVEPGTDHFPIGSIQVHSSGNTPDAIVQIDETSELSFGEKIGRDLRSAVSGGCS